MKFRPIIAVKPPTRFESLSKIHGSGLWPLGILQNDPHRAGGLTANTPYFMILLIITIVTYNEVAYSTSWSYDNGLLVYVRISPSL